MRTEKTSSRLSPANEKIVAKKLKEANDFLAGLDMSKLPQPPKPTQK